MICIPDLALRRNFPALGLFEGQLSERGEGAFLALVLPVERIFTNQGENATIGTPVLDLPQHQITLSEARRDLSGRDEEWGHATIGKC